MQVPPLIRGMMVPARRQMRAGTGFTLVELLIVISVILMLIGMLMSAMTQVRQSSYKAAAAAVVQNLQAAMAAYVLEQHLLPPTAPGNVLRTNAGTGGPPQTLDLLADDGFQVPGSEQLCDAAVANPRHLLDDWGRQFSYTVDQVVPTAVLSRPTPTIPQDWNPDGKVPFAYLWSLGRPSGQGLAHDLDPTLNLAAWIHPRTP